MIKKLSLALLLSLSSVNATTFEDSDAGAMATPLYVTAHNIIEKLPPYERLLPKNPCVFDAWYMNTLEKNFHNLVTPLLELKVIDRLAQGLCCVDEDDLNLFFLPTRNQLMSECIMSAYEKAAEATLLHLENEALMAPSPYAGALLVLRHYKEREMSDSSDVFSSPVPTASYVEPLDDGMVEVIVGVEGGSNG